MRWSAPSERTQLVIASPILVPVVIAAVPFVVAMAGALAVGDWWARRQKYDVWHSWFAWRPVRFDYDPEYGRWAWLETIERRRFFSGCVSYRPPPQDTEEASEHD